MPLTFLAENKLLGRFILKYNCSTYVIKVSRCSWSSVYVSVRPATLHCVMKHNFFSDLHSS